LTDDEDTTTMMVFTGGGPAVVGPEKIPFEPDQDNRHPAGGLRREVIEILRSVLSA